MCLADFIARSFTKKKKKKKLNKSLFFVVNYIEVINNGGSIIVSFLPEIPSLLTPIFEILHMKKVIIMQQCTVIYVFQELIGLAEKSSTSVLLPWLF